MSRLIYGRYDERGSALLTFFLRGVRHEPPGVEYEGIIDTGFTGFVQLPIHQAFALALPLQGTLDATMADGRTVTHLTALAEATIEEGGEIVTGIVSLATNSREILIGMEFLKRFGLGLFMSGEHVVLFEGPPPETEPDEEQ